MSILHTLAAPLRGVVVVAGAAAVVACAAEATPLVTTDGDLGQQKAATPTDELETEQLLRGMRPEFFDYFWNNLDAARFARWHPDAHASFAWTRAPKVPGDLKAEVDASYTATVAVGGARHALTVTYRDPRALEGARLETTTVADVTIDGSGPYRLTIDYQLEGDDVRMRQRFALPESADRAAWKAYLDARMTNLAGFIRDLFQKQYVDVELTERGVITVTPGPSTTDVVVTQKIAKLTTEMVDWWWDNMGGTDRYRHWHPTAHQQFTWTTPPKNATDLVYDVGSMQQVVEVIDAATTLNIGWLDPTKVPIPLTYERFIYGSTNLNGTPFGGFLVHEYAAAEGGITMKSTFRIPSLSGAPFAQALGRHCIQEMQFLQYYLPGLFAREYRR